MIVEGEGQTRCKLVCFCLGDQEFAADIESIKESLTLRPITRVALTPPWIAGIINLRGDVLAVLDLAHFLGMAPTTITDESRIIVGEHEGRHLGLLCDALSDLRVLDATAIESPPSTLSETTAAMLKGILTVDGGLALRLLDLAAVFESKQLAAFRRGGRS